MIKEGKLEVVARTGGIKLSDNPGFWLNPDDSVKDKILDDLDEIKKMVGKRVVVEMSSAKDFRAIGLSEEQDDEGSSVDVKDYVISIKGKEFITYKGLLALAHKKGIKSFEVISLFVSDDMKRSWCKVRVHTRSGAFFDGVGSSTPENTGAMTSNHPIEMAHTRAKGRALRDFLNVGMSMVEELKDAKEDVKDDSVKVEDIESDVGDE